jgi:hypothetical protein
MIDDNCIFRYGGGDRIIQWSPHMAQTVNPRQRPEIEMEVLPDGSALLFDPRDDHGHVLTALGALVWDMCDGELDHDAIVAECSALIPQVPTIPETVRTFLEEFHQLDLLLPSQGEAMS